MHSAHEAAKILDELLAPHADHRGFAVGLVKLVSDLDQLSVSIEPLEPAIFTIVTWLIYHVEPMSTLFKTRVPDGEVLPPEYPHQGLSQLGRVSVRVGPKFPRYALVSLWRLIRVSTVSRGVGLRYD